MDYQTEAVLRQAREVVSRLQEINKEYQQNNEKLLTEIKLKYSQPTYDEAPTPTPPQTPVEQPAEYVPPTPQELYEARLNNSDLWKQHLEKVREIYQ
ncbi:hypothetical protein CAL7716_053440 [Calothrix sp. PCC 7716]|nr:hypothetical protein CAL7716_053440 [Calothrix sp. PCC 7716]